jgi:transcriptional regulator with XRE-family HTH domain
MARLAELSGISRQHIWRIEKGLVPSPGKEILERLAISLAVGVSSLVPASGGRDRALNILLQNASRIRDDDWQFFEQVAREVSSEGNAPPRKERQRRAQCVQREAFPRTPAEQASSGHEFPDEVKVIGQYFADRAKQPEAWRTYVKEAYKLRAKLRERS